MSLPTNFKSSGGFDANNKTISSVADPLAAQDALNLRTLDAKNTVVPYIQSRSYPIDFIVEYSGQLWKCVAVTTGVFDKTKWKAITGQENWIRITGSYTAKAMDSLHVDTSSGAVIITMPAVATSGDYVIIRDAGFAATNSITVANNGLTINGVSQNIVLNDSDVIATLVYLNGTWILNTTLINRIKSVSGAAITATQNKTYAFETSASFTLTLPAAPKAGDWVEVFDRSGTVGSYPITVSGGSKQIDGGSSIILNQTKGGWVFIYNGTAWVSYAHFGNGLQADKNLTDLQDKAAARTALQLGTMALLNSGTAAGEFRTNSQNDTAFQVKDATLTAVAALVTSADKLIYSTGLDQFALTTITAQARAFLAAGTTTAQQTALGLGTAATKDAGTAVGNVMPVGTGGIGGTAVISTEPNLNAYRAGGFYITPATGIVNLPSGWVQGRHSVIVTGGTVNYITQILSNVSQNTSQPGKIAWRWMNSDNDWSAWTEFGTPDSFGTAATRDVGLATGNVLEVGAAGVAATQMVQISTDLNLVIATGSYYTNPSCPNLPEPTTSFLEVNGSDAASQRCSQTVRTVTTGKIYERSQFGGTWSAWKEVVTSNQIGTAAASNTGTNLGDVMQVGAFGIGSGDGFDLNSFEENVPSGFYRAYGEAVSGSASVGAPPGSGNVQLGVIATTIASSEVTNYLAFETGAIVSDRRLWSGQYYAGQIFWSEVITTDTKYEDWIVPTLVSGWLEYGAGSYQVGYRKIQDCVELKGLVKSGTAGSTIFTLPVGYRASDAKSFIVLINGTSYGYLTTNTTGNVSLQTVTPSATISWVSLDGIRIPL